MPETPDFGGLLEAIDALPVDEQEELADVLGKRLREKRRAEIVQEVQQARQEFADGSCTPASAADILKNASR